MLYAVARDPTRTDLAALGRELPQHEKGLVVDVVDLFLAEYADFAFALLLLFVVFVFFVSFWPGCFPRHPVVSPLSSRPPRALGPRRPSRSRRKTWRIGWPW